MKKKTLKLKIVGRVAGNFVNTREKTGLEDRQINIEVTDKQVDVFENKLLENGMEWSGDNYPVKVNPDTDIPYIKVHSQFAIRTKNIPMGFTIADLGVGSEITAYINIKEGQYGRKKYVSAYLTALDCHEFIEIEEYNAFEDGEYEAIYEESANVDSDANDA